jgi:oligopeptide transport system substrate-binding protein
VRPRAVLTLLLVAVLAGGGCFESEEGEQFYGRVSVPREQEFRWSDGGLPRVFDPARAAAPPDTDAVRALFEGLTDSDPQTLAPLPAVALKWEASGDWRQWTFHLRRDATWSNGDRVTAEDFVRSWQRTLRLDDAPHAALLANIRGAEEVAGEVKRAPQQATEGAGVERADPTAEAQAPPPPRPAAKEPFGAEAVDAHTLRVTLRRPDKSFPALVAHPVFRPFHELSPSADLAALEGEAERGGAESQIISVVTNGAFRLSGVGGGSVVLERAANYWAASTVRLERVRFVETRSAEEALAAYKSGEVDAVTNAGLEPLAVKILTPYKDFRRGTFGALLYYQFNTKRPPFNDQRVREAFAVALDVERLSADTLGGATEPARRFLPEQIASNPRDDSNTNAPGAAPSSTPSAAPAASGRGTAGAVEVAEGDGAQDVGGAADEAAVPVERNVERARRLLAEAGYPGGANFPELRLLVNRNEQQRLLAQAAERMWERALGVEIKVEVRDWEQYEAERRAGEYDIVRRSIVLQTTDEETNILSMFGEQAALGEGEVAVAGATGSPPAATPGVEQSPPPPAPPAESPAAPILNEAQALRELPAVPVYFASSYALVKPYVSGFHSNLLDAPSLKHVRIETGWKPPARGPVGVLTVAGAGARRAKD